MTVEDLVREITALSIDDRARLRKQLGIVELVENGLRHNNSARFEVINDLYGKIEGTLYIGTLLREVCRRIQQRAFPQDLLGKRVNDGPTVIVTGDGAGGFIERVINGPVDGGALFAIENTVFNMLSDFRQYEDLFHDLFERLAAVIEDRVIRDFENRNYLGPNHIEQRTLRYTEDPKKRRDKIWRPPLKDDQKFSPGRHSEKTVFERNLEIARQSLRKKQVKITQQNLAEEMGYQDPRSLTKQLRVYGMQWSEIKNRN